MRKLERRKRRKSDEMEPRSREVERVVRTRASGATRVNWLDDLRAPLHGQARVRSFPLCAGSDTQQQQTSSRGNKGPEMGQFSLALAVCSLGKRYSAAWRGDVG